MKVISSHLDNEMNISEKPEKVEFTCDKHSQKINLNIVDIPDETRRLLLVVYNSKDGNFLNRSVWNILERKFSTFVADPKTDIEKDKLLMDDNPADDNPNVDLYEALCNIEGESGTAYRLLVRALDNEPRIEDMGNEDVDKAIEGHILDSVEVVVVSKGEK